MNNKNNVIQVTIIFLFLVSLLSCSSKPEPNLELFSPEAFAFDLGESWEINASVNAKGFAKLISKEYVQKTGRKILDTDNGHIILDDKVKTKILENIYHTKISYSVDLITPKADSLFSIFSNIVEEGNSEELIDLFLEAQIEIDSSFTEGDYKLIFNVKDELSNQTKSINLEFNLTN